MLIKYLEKKDCENDEKIRIYPRSIILITMPCIQIRKTLENEKVSMKTIIQEIKREENEAVIMIKMSTQFSHKKDKKMLCETGNT